MSRKYKIALFEQAVIPKQYELDTIVKLLIWHMMFHPDTMKANDYVAQSLKMLCNALNPSQFPPLRPSFRTWRKNSSLVT